MVSEQDLLNISTRLEHLESVIERLRAIEAPLDVLVANIDFFKGTIDHLYPRLNSLENLTQDSLTVRIRSIEEKLATTPAANAPATVAPAAPGVNPELREVRQDLANLRAQFDEFSANCKVHLVTKGELETAISTSSKHASTKTAKPKLALPAAFSGKREEWKTFASHLNL
ncbi:hypothetical protein BGZ94_006531, partial [Podila epigama]